MERGHWDFQNTGAPDAQGQQTDLAIMTKNLSWCKGAMLPHYQVSQDLQFSSSFQTPISSPFWRILFSSNHPLSPTHAYFLFCSIWHSWSLVFNYIFYYNTPIMMTWNTALCLWYLWFPFNSIFPGESQFQIFCPIVLINALTLIKPSVLNFSF